MAVPPKSVLLPVAPPKSVRYYRGGSTAKSTAATCGPHNHSATTLKVPPITVPLRSKMVLRRNRGSATITVKIQNHGVAKSQCRHIDVPPQSLPKSDHRTAPPVPPQSVPPKPQSRGAKIKITPEMIFAQHFYTRQKLSTYPTKFLSPSVHFGGPLKSTVPPQSKLKVPPVPKQPAPRKSNAATLNPYGTAKTTIQSSAAKII